VEQFFTQNNHTANGGVATTLLSYTMCPRSRCPIGPKYKNRNTAQVHAQISRYRITWCYACLRGCQVWYGTPVDELARTDRGVHQLEGHEREHITRTT
jgi:hypothetical protein